MVLPQSATFEKGVEVSSVTVSAQAGGRKVAYADVREFWETKGLHLVPAPEFLVSCDVTGRPGLSAGDFVLWTTIDFVVAPATRELEAMVMNQLAASVSWGQVTEMKDLRATEFYALRASPHDSA